MQNGAVKQEIKCRLAKSSSAFHQRKAVLSSPQLAARVRLAVFTTYVTCHLTQNAGISPAFSNSDYMRLKAMYMTLIRKVVEEASNAHRVSELSDEVICS
eukprot:6055215-Amphidinium_carterae.1